MAIADIGIIIGGILAPIATALYFIVKEVRKIQVKNRLRLNGNWTNEGDITSLETDFIRINLQVDKEDGQIIGLAHCDSLIPVTSQAIHGQLKFSSAIIHIGRVSHQQYVETLKARLTLKGKNLLWKVIRDNHEMKPHKTILFKSDFE
ncbi:MAG TPA: hypothetical protein DIT07_02085 [Sphingobacteriaceae bacterium]|nr:hypothetical protein [Sphingobacteriaceae bacterium]